MSKLKTCTKCQMEKSEEEFYQFTHSNGRVYRRSRCRLCFNKLSEPYQKIYYSKAETKERINKSRRDKRKSDPELRARLLVQAASAYRKSIRNNILLRAKRRATKLGLLFNIDLGDVTIPEYCPILDIPIFIGTRSSYRNAPSLDRVCIDKGYVKGNVRVISMAANTMKNSATFDELKKFSVNILSYIEEYDIVQPIGNIQPIELQNKESVG